jgi:hypothetical protein
VYTERMTLHVEKDKMLWSVVNLNNLILGYNNAGN